MGADSGTSFQQVSTLLDDGANSIFSQQKIHSVKDVFADKCVLVTGASGFLGKVLVEKLLYSMPRIKEIFLLIRPNKHDSPKDRLHKMIQNPLFNRIRCTDSSLFDKLVPIGADLMKADLGLSDTDSKLLCENAAIVFHCAATVKFDEPLRVSIQMNVIGTQRLMALCHKMTQLICVVHTSTAYANCNLARTDERIYSPCAHPEKLIAASEWMDASMLDALAPQLLDARPNTYTFAKALAECQLHENARGLPLIILRPSIIGAMWRDPLPGWTDNVNGPTGLFAAVGKGILTNMCGKEQANADIIPVDIVSNALIAAAAYRASHSAEIKLKDEEIPVIHCCSGALNPLKWGRIVVYLEQFFHKYPLDDCFRVPSTQFHTNRTAFLVNFYLKHYLPAYAVDMALRIMWRKPKFVRIYGKVWRMVETLHYFTTRGWKFESDNIMHLWNSLSDNDQKTYNFDIRQIDWDNYLFDYLMGLKIYLLKEKLENLPKARSNIAWVRQISLYGNTLTWALLVRIFAWRRTRKEKWTLWLIGTLFTYSLQNFTLRPKVHLKSVEEYRKSALPYYA